MSAIHYIKLMARHPMKRGSLQQNYRFFDGLMHHYLIKHMFKIDLQKDEI